MKFDPQWAGLSGVYKITCVENGKQYFGATTDFRRRYREHAYSLSRGSHRNPYLQQDFDAYGQDAFEFSVLVVTDDPADRDRLEADYIAEARSNDACYNIFDGGRFGKVSDPTFGEKASVRNKGSIVPDERRAKISSGTKKQWENEEYRALMVASAKRQWQNPVYRETMLRTNRGKKLSPEQRQHLIEINTGRKASEETKRKMSLKRRGEDNGRAKLTAEQVRCIRARADEGESDVDLAQEYGVAPTTINSIIRRKTWKYV